MDLLGIAVELQCIIIILVVVRQLRDGESCYRLWSMNKLCEHSMFCSAICILQLNPPLQWISPCFGLLHHTHAMIVLWLAVMRHPFHRGIYLSLSGRSTPPIAHAVSLPQLNSPLEVFSALKA